MSKTKRIIMLLTDTLLLLAGIGALLGFIAFTDLLKHHRWAGYPTRDQILATTDTNRLQVMAAVASDNWWRFSDVVAAARWFVLASGSIVVASSIVHLFLNPRKPKGPEQ